MLKISKWKLQRRLFWRTLSALFASLSKPPFPSALRRRLKCSKARILYSLVEHSKVGLDGRGGWWNLHRRKDGKPFIQIHSGTLLCVPTALDHNAVKRLMLRKPKSSPATPKAIGPKTMACESKWVEALIEKAPPICWVLRQTGQGGSFQLPLTHNLDGWFKA